MEKEYTSDLNGKSSESALPNLSSAEDFKIVSMRIKDADSQSKLFWEVKDWDLTN